MMTYAGDAYAPRNPRDAIRGGITYVPEDRRNHGCVGPLSVQQNLTLLDLRSLGSAFWLSKRAERKEARRLIEQFDIRPSDPLRPISKLSGGNQQKAVLAKALRVSPRVVLLDEPTQGIDVGARAEIEALVLRLASEGLAVVLASSDAAELSALCDRLIVLDRGRLKAELRRPDISEDRLALTISGGALSDSA
jgi:ribose transport system ATP-binding protein